MFNLILKIYRLFVLGILIVSISEILVAFIPRAEKSYIVGKYTLESLVAF